MIKILDFYADWCGPCHMQTPVLNALLEEYGEKLSVEKIDVEQDEARAKEFNVMSIPTLVIFNNEEKVETLVGYHDKASLKKLIDSYLE